MCFLLFLGLGDCGVVCWYEGFGGLWLVDWRGIVLLVCWVWVLLGLGDLCGLDAFGFTCGLRAGVGCCNIVFGWFLGGFGFLGCF